MVKRKTVFQQMFLVDSVLYNKLNHINNNTNNVFFKQNPSSPPSQPPTQVPSLKDQFITPDLPKSEFARSLMDSGSDTFSQTGGVKNRSTMTKMPKRADADSQTMSPMTDDVERFTRVAGPPSRSATGSPPSATGPPFAPLQLHRSLGIAPPPALQNEECMECTDENPIQTIANTNQITNEHNQHQTVTPPQPLQSLQNIQRSSYRYRPYARDQLQFENNVRAIAPTSQGVSRLQNMIESAPYTQNMLQLENNETAIAPALQPKNLIANNVRHSNQYQSYFNDRVLVKYSCLLCNTDFSTQKALERHMKNIHDAYQQKEKGKKRQQTFTCDFCNSDFKSERALDRHIDNVHDAAFQEKRGAKRPGSGKKPPHKYKKFF